MFDRVLYTPLVIIAYININSDSIKLNFSQTHQRSRGIDILMIDESFRITQFVIGGSPPLLKLDINISIAGILVYVYLTPHQIC